MLNIQKNYLIFIVIFLFYLKEKKSKNVISLFVKYITKKIMSFTKELNHGLKLKKVHRVIKKHG